MKKFIYLIIVFVVSCSPVKHNSNTSISGDTRTTKHLLNTTKNSYQEFNIRNFMISIFSYCQP